ncbi:MAG: hypothetical protein POG24_04750 [Acidocella sp.]|nr:hypothetical protein [Acidocella sp.]
MNDDPITTIVSQLSALFGNDAARIIGATMVLIIVTAHGVMPWIPVATATDTPWYRHFYKLLQLIAGNYGNATPKG